MSVAELIGDLLAQADERGISRARLAEKAGIRPETLSRLQYRDNADLRTVSNLAAAAGYRLALIPLDAANGDSVFSPVEMAREKAASRERDEALVASGKASRHEVHRRNAFISLANAEVEIK